MRSSFYRRLSTRFRTLLEVLARIEAGAGRDLGDALDLRDRCLDLFKVTSQDGVVAVWLMGKKIVELSK